MPTRVSAWPRRPARPTSHPRRVRALRRLVTPPGPLPAHRPARRRRALPRQHRGRPHPRRPQARRRQPRRRQPRRRGDPQRRPDLGVRTGHAPTTASPFPPRRPAVPLRRTVRPRHRRPTPAPAPAPRHGAGPGHGRPARARRRPSAVPLRSGPTGRRTRHPPHRRGAGGSGRCARRRRRRRGAQRRRSSPSSPPGPASHATPPSHLNPPWTPRPGCVRASPTFAGWGWPPASTSLEVATAEPFEEVRATLEERKAAGLHGGMAFTYRNPARSTDPSLALPGARTLVVGARSYLAADADAGGPAASARRRGSPATPGDDHYALLHGGLDGGGRGAAGTPGGGRGCWSTTTRSSTGRPPTGPASAGAARTPTCCCPGWAAGSCSARCSPTRR